MHVLIADDAVVVWMAEQTDDTQDEWWHDLFAKPSVTSTLETASSGAASSILGDAPAEQTDDTQDEWWHDLFTKPSVTSTVETSRSSATSSICGVLPLAATNLPECERVERLPPSITAPRRAALIARLCRLPLPPKGSRERPAETGGPRRDRSRSPELLKFTGVDELLSKFSGDALPMPAQNDIIDSSHLHHGTWESLCGGICCKFPFRPV